MRTIGLIGGMSWESSLLYYAFTMEEDFYRDRLREQHGVHCLLPSATERAHVHRIIYEELCAGIVSDTSRQVYAQIVADGVETGAHGVILGCTEIGLLLKQEHCPVPLFDTAALHAAAAVDFALSDG
jgi:aspartate racemase